MRTLSDTISRLSRSRMAVRAPPSNHGPLIELRDFGSNPGALRGWLHIPTNLQSGSALVVVLHGCTQTAASYNHGGGWSEMADRHGFAVLFPEQQRQNNPNLCFNWFLTADTARESGEAYSIRQMVASTAASSKINPARVFVTGLSAGGAMAGAMLAAYPDVFAGGAIIAGLPSGSAKTIPEAFDRMRGHNLPNAAQLSASVRRASGHLGPWPSLSVWQGSADATVHPANADAIVAQWLAVHGLDKTPDATERIGPHSRRIWRDEEGRDVVEQISVAGMGHGTPLKTGGTAGCGAPGPFMLEAGISSTQEICRYWSLLRDDARTEILVQAEDLVTPSGIQTPRTDAATSLHRMPRPPRANQPGVRDVIEDALRKAGLMP